MFEHIQLNVFPRLLWQDNFVSRVTAKSSVRESDPDPALLPQLQLMKAGEETCVSMTRTETVDACWTGNCQYSHKLSNVSADLTSCEATFPSPPPPPSEPLRLWPPGNNGGIDYCAYDDQLQSPYHLMRSDSCADNYWSCSPELRLSAATVKQVRLITSAAITTAHMPHVINAK